MNKLELSMLIKNTSIKNYFKNNETFTWVKDKNVENCYKCNIKFSLINRRHHCRNCGKIFCHECSKYLSKIPNYNSENEIANFFNKNIIEYIKKSDFQRTCNNCFTNINNFYDVMKLVKVFDLLPLDIKDYIIISQVCKTWNKIAKYYLSYVSNIQYYLPLTYLKKKDINILNYNLKFFSGHSAWIVKLIIHFSKLKIKDVELIDLIKNNNKSISCRHFDCKSLCHKKINLEDVIVCINCNMTNYKLVKYLISIIENVHPNNLLLFLNNIIYKLSFYQNYPNILDLLINFLIEKSKQSIEFSNSFFWLLTKNIFEINNNNLWSDIRKKLINSFDEHKYNLFISTYDFSNNLIKIIDNKGDIIKNIQSHFNKNIYFLDNQVILPIDVTKKVNIDFKNIKILNSKTKPILLPIKSNNIEKKIMIKNEDITKEFIIMELIKFIDIVLKRDIQLDLNIVKYKILPVSNNYGYIEFVENSYTLYGIKEIHNFSIQNFIMEKNPNITVKELRDNFTKSCASYCIISYILGIGDRHLDNIMITNKGYIFNIDFGYILGTDPKIIAPEFRITSEMIDAMGGLNSQYYNDFKKYCSISYNCLRKHIDIIYLLLLQLTKLKNSNLNEKNIKDYIYERLMPNENFKEAELHFNYKIVNNSKNYTGEVIDYFHKKAKDFSGSNTTEETIYESAVNVINSTSALTKNIKNGLKKNKNKIISN